jgi:hypothetical protein
MTLDEATARELAEKLVVFLETNTPPDGLFTPDVFCDLSVPLWRLQAVGLAESVALRKAGHPVSGRVPRSRFDVTGSGFLLEVEEEWEQDSDTWYCRELIRADVTDGAVSSITVYCTGDWDSALVARHATEVSLARP